MRCPKCQSENPETRKFCRECGAKLLQICPQCGSENLPGDKFCGECGHDLREPKEAPFIDYSQPQSYTPKSLVDKILAARSTLEGERKLVTVLFADVAGYTSISEKLDPEEVGQIMDGCFGVLIDEIHRYEGTIDKFTGDGAMALFGAPVAHEDHAQRACYAALAIQGALKEYAEKIRKEYGMDFQMRVGLNSGLVVVGSVGNNLRMDYTAVGDTVNLASRMESMAKPGAILVSANTHRMARDFLEFEPLGKIQVKGKEEPVEAYKLIKASQVQTRMEAAVVRGLTRFVGRQREIATLKEAFKKAQSGSGQVVGMVGEAGVGKSRLLLELRGILPGEEYTYLEGRCLHYGGSIVYLPLLDILKSYFDIKVGEQEFVIKKKMGGKINKLDEKLKGILAPLQEILSLTVEDEGYLKLEPPQKREKIFEAVRDLLIRESQDKPLVLAVEDLHWIDRTSEEFLTYLIGWLANTHILLLLLYRSEYTHPWASKSYYSQINIGHLPTSAAAELVQAILEEEEVAPELKELILNRAGGNPLFMEEFTHTLLENGSIQRKDRQYVLSIKVSDIQVPDTIQGIITARIDRLEENLKRIMQVASVIGRDFAFRILQTISGMQEEIKSALLNLQGLEFIYEKSLFPELEYTFKHALTQEVAYSSLLLRRRKEIHEKIGGAIEELYSDRLEEFYEVLAHHYSRSESSEKAYQYLKLSGNKALRSYSSWEAFHFYQEAVNILKQLPETEENKRRGIEVRLLMDSPMRLLSYPEDSLQILQEGERLSVELRDERSLANFYSSMCFYYTVQGEPLQGTKYAENCFRMAEGIQDIDLAAPIGFDLCASYNIAGELLKLVEVALKVLALLEKTQRESEFCGGPFNFNYYSAICAYCGYAMAYLGNFEEGKRMCEKGLRFALEINDVNSIAWAEFTYGIFFAVQGDGGNAVKHLQNSIRHQEEGQVAVILGLTWGGLGWAYYLLGDLETARKHIEKALEIQRDEGLSLNLAINYYYLSMAQFGSGDLENARSSIEESLKLAQNTDEKWMEGQTSIFLGRILGKAEKSQCAKAEEYILQGIKIVDELKLKPSCSQGYFFLGELYADMGQKQRALENLKRAQGMFGEMGMDYWLRQTQTVLERLQR
jgi:class 3 adenylate cyclase/tetratricopeptide (TPR) repeat protein